MSYEDHAGYTAPIRQHELNRTDLEHEVKIDDVSEVCKLYTTVLPCRVVLDSQPLIHCYHKCAVSHQVMYHAVALDHTASSMLFGTLKVRAVELDPTTRPATEYAVSCLLYTSPSPRD